MPALRQVSLKLSGAGPAAEAAAAAEASAEAAFAPLPPVPPDSARSTAALAACTPAAKPLRFDRCGTFGCILADRHPGLHIFEQAAKRQRPAKKEPVEEEAADPRPNHHAGGISRERAAGAGAKPKVAKLRGAVKQAVSKKAERSAKPPPFVPTPHDAAPEGSDAWRVGSLLSALDVRGIWCDAVVLSERGDGATRELKVHYSGWNKRWDEWKYVRGGELRGRPERVAVPSVYQEGARPVPNGTVVHRWTVRAPPSFTAEQKRAAAAAAAAAAAGSANGAGPAQTEGDFTYIYSPMPSAEV